MITLKEPLTSARVELVDQAPGAVPNQVSDEDLELVEQCAQQLVLEHHAFRADQHHTPANALVHERTTGPEIWEQSGGRLDVFVDYAGSGGSFTGVSRFLRSKSDAIRCDLVEPAAAAVLAGEVPTNVHHKIQGGDYAMELPILDRALVTDYLRVTDVEAMNAVHLPASEEAIFAGFSSGANLAAALQLLSTREKSQTIAFLICDSGLKYISTDFWDK